MRKSAYLMACGVRTSNPLKAPRNLIPLFLCPLLASCSGGSHRLGKWRLRRRRHQLHVDAAAAASHGFPTPSQLPHLPRSCPGCGALTQLVSPEQPGFYGTNRKSVKAFIGCNGQYPGSEYPGESQVFEHVLGVANRTLLSQVGLQGGGDNIKNSQIL